jgi:hypothetical protein
LTHTAPREITGSACGVVLEIVPKITLDEIDFERENL